MNKAKIDGWYTGAIPSNENTDFLRARCIQLSINGILWEDVKRSVEDMQVRLPGTYLHELKIDKGTLDAWKNGRSWKSPQTSGFALTNNLRARIATSLAQAERLALPQP